MNKPVFLRGLVVLGLGLPATAQIEVQRIVPPLPNSGALGNQIELDGDTAAVTLTAPDNVRVLVLGRRTGVWDLDHELAFPVYERPEGLALDGDSLLVGYSTFPDRGRVLAFERNQGVWAQTQTLIPSGWSADGDFGRRIDLDGDRAVIAAPMDESQTYRGGTIYVFEKTGGAWVETARIEPTLTCCRPFFGLSVAIDGDLIVAGQPGFEGSSPNYVYAYRYDGSTWNLEQQLYETTSTIPGISGGAFGWSVDADQTRIVVGARDDPGPPGPVSGAAFVFEKNGNQWLLRDTLMPTDPREGSRFGTSVSLDGNRLAIGAVQAWGGLESVSTYTEGLNGFALDSVIRRGPFELGYFGSTLALEGGTMLVGAPREDYPSGAIHAYSFPVGVRYCVATPNSTGRAAHIHALGTESIRRDGFTLRAAPVPDTAGLFFFGPNSTQVSFGDGYRCVGGALRTLRNTRVDAGALSHGVDFRSPAAILLTVGSTWNFQAWFRDPTPGGFGFGTSDGVRVTFLP